VAPLRTGSTTTSFHQNKLSFINPS